MLVYMDLCCFNRPFDDQSQPRIYLETEAKLFIQRKINPFTSPVHSDVRRTFL